MPLGLLLDFQACDIEIECTNRLKLLAGEGIIDAFCEPYMPDSGCFVPFKVSMPQQTLVLCFERAVMVFFGKGIEEKRRQCFLENLLCGCQLQSFSYSLEEDPTWPAEGDYGYISVMEAAKRFPSMYSSFLKQFVS